MGGTTGKKNRSLNRKAKSKPRAEIHVTLAQPPVNLASLIRGIYRRVARQLHVDPSYVSRVARRERRSKIIEIALRRELIRILEDIKKGRSVPSPKTSLKKPARNTKKS